MAHRKKTNKLKNPPTLKSIKWKEKLLKEGPKSWTQALLYAKLKNEKNE
tara:strand:+ start:468 stop:614 length:147 start_codon:yes stop_codon:yes gene_type:complete